MRAGICNIQQALTAEAASIVKQALTLARRRNHAQVTPLHVAISLLESSSSLLRKACLKSHSHPLQCKALELCFNVSLNRLPTSTSSPFLASHSSSSLSLSNALVAAFKRAQAHQRRGSIESQQQPILALKIEIEQLVISILDDPSVSRVMREAGFSSTQVKSNVEQAVSFEFCPQSSPLSSTSVSKNCITPLIQLGPTFAIKPINQVREKDVMSVLNSLMRERKQNNVIVGECLASAENVVRGVMDKLERGDVDGHLRFIQFINLPLFSFKNASREEIEQKIGDLKCLVRNFIAKGVVLYLGDLKWVTDFWSSCCVQKRSYYCPVQHMIMEIRRLVCSVFGDGGKLWLMGTANFQTYMKCKTGHPSLESLWDLRPLAIPVGSLGLSLTIDSDLQAHSKSKVSTDWSVGFEKEALSNASIPKSDSTTITTTSMTSKLPSWLQNYKEENRAQIINDHQESVHVGDLSKKWDSFFGSVQKQPLFSDKGYTSSYSSPTSTSISSYDQRGHKLHQARELSWPVIFESKSLPKEHQFWMNEKDDDSFEANPRMLIIPEKGEPKPDLISNPNSSPNSATSSEAGEGTEDLPMFKEINAENLSFLCNALEKKVPWQKEIILDIVKTVLQCRSGMIKRKGKLTQREEEKEETWLFFLGADTEGKLRIARELSRLIFGSLSNFVSINSGSSFSSTRADSTDDFRNKRKRDELAGSCLNRFAEALHDNPHCVFFVEEVEQLDYCSQMGIKRAIESGRITLPSGDSVPLDDAIVIFSCESLSSMSRACSPPPIQRKCNDSQDKEDGELERSLPISLDLNIAAGDETAKDHSVSDIEIKDSVDKQIMFKIREL